MLELNWRSEAGWIVIEGTSDGRPVDVDRWPVEAPQSLASAAARFWSLVEDEQALAEGAQLYLPHREAAALTPKQRAAAGLPEPPPVTLAVQHRGTLESDAFGLEYSWYMTSGRPVVAPTRDGAFLTIGGRTHLLPLELFEVVEAIDAFNAIPTSQPDERAAAWVLVQEHLPAGEEASREVDASRYLREVRIAHAGAFSLRPFEVDGTVDFDPVLFAAKPATPQLADDDDADPADPDPLLPEAHQDLFAGERFRKAARARGRYVLQDGWILVLSPALRRAMDVVHKAQAAGGDVARDFVRNPRGYLREALGDELDEHLVESLFKETRDYSERVQEIGLWQKKVLPWVQVPREPWLPPEALGLVIDGSPVQLPSEQIAELIAEVEAALERGEPKVSFQGVDIPVTAESLAALRHIQDAAGGEDATAAKDELADDSASPDEAGPSPERHVLIVKNNFDEVVFNSDPAPRAPALDRELHTPLLKTRPKPHQIDGLNWLQDCWQTGWTGALLADDMGLGKTFQTLAFLAWLKSASRAGLLPHSPILIVAPTGLLRNWEKEHGIHLQSPGLGEVVRAYGASLQELRLSKGAELALGEPILDVERLRAADWVLTTYETLRDYQHSFGRVPFLIAVFDEAQKIKTPGTQITDAAKAMRAEFVLALTGTPIENRLADLWCIMDTLHPGALGDLKAFSSRYEASPSPDDLTRLKSALTQAGSGRPAVMLRRMKDEVLDALPSKTNHVFERDMPTIQSNAYAAIVNEARRQSGQGRMLEALQAMRQVSLAPLQRSVVATDADYINSSGRLLAAFEVLDEIKTRDEKVLIFVEYREAQSELAGIIQRRYGLTRTPMIISGDVSGPQRQLRVDEFQSKPAGFDVIILSPKAGGVGITLTAANNVIHLTRWWNPAVEDQSTDRCYRIGQERAVNVYYPMAVLPGQPEHSFDRRLHALLERKRELSRDMLLPVGGTAEDARKLYEETTA